MKKCNTHKSATSDDTRYFQISRLISSATCTFWFSLCLYLSKLRHIERVTRYLSCTGRYVKHIIILSIICHVRWNQVFADITLNLFIYLYLLISNIPLFVNILAYKTSSLVFLLHRKKCNTHNYIKHHLPRQMIPDICRYPAKSRQILVPFDFHYAFICPNSGI